MTCPARTSRAASAPTARAAASTTSTVPPARRARSGAPPPPEDGLTASAPTLIFDHPERFDRRLRRRAAVSRAIDLVSRRRTRRRPSRPPARDFLVRASQLPANQLESNLFFASVALGEIVHRRTRGKHPWGNVGVTYALAAAHGRRARGARRRASIASDFRRRGRSLPAALLRAARAHAREGDRRCTRSTTASSSPSTRRKYGQAFEAAGRDRASSSSSSPRRASTARTSAAFTPALER